MAGKISELLSVKNRRREGRQGTLPKSPDYHITVLGSSLYLDVASKPGCERLDTYSFIAAAGGIPGNSLVEIDVIAYI